MSSVVYPHSVWARWKAATRDRRPYAQPREMRDIRVQRPRLLHRSLQEGWLSSESDELESSTGNGASGGMISDRLMESSEE